jgi:hypothetical protein
MAVQGPLETMPFLLTEVRVISGEGGGYKGTNVRNNKITKISLGI